MCASHLDVGDSKYDPVSAFMESKSGLGKQEIYSLLVKDNPDIGKLSTQCYGRKGLQKFKGRKDG